MLVKTSITVPLDLIEAAETNSFDIMKTTINEPTGNFFYDPWVIKKEFLGSVWERLINPLGGNIGEARIIILESPKAYTQHADIDDRYHLNITGEGSYLIDLEDQNLYPLSADGVWYIMDAGKLHSAIAVGKRHRIQLVVRKLLSHSNLKQPIKVVLTLLNEQSRYDFDNIISTWLNRASKHGKIDNFQVIQTSAEFDVEEYLIEELSKIVPKSLDLKIT